jgi:hypothetical protein
MALEPTVDRRVELDVVGLGELRVRLDAQLRYALLEGGVIEWPYHYLHCSSPEVGPSLILAPLSTTLTPLTHELSPGDPYHRGSVKEQHLKSKLNLGEDGHPIVLRNAAESAHYGFRKP